MTKRSLTVLWCGLGLTLALGLILLALLLKPQSRLDSGDVLHTVHIAGEFVTAEGTMPVNAALDAPETIRNAVSAQICGHFLCDLPAGSTLMLRIRDARIRLCVNGEEILTYGQRNSYPALARSTGDIWYCLTSPGIQAEDEVELTVERIYDGTSVNVYAALLDNMFVGSPNRLLLHVLRQSWSSLLLGVIVCSMGLLVLAVAIVALCLKMPYVRQMLLFSGATLSAGLWMLFNFNYISLLIPYPTFNMTIAYFAFYGIPPFLLLYCRTFLTQWRRMTVTLAGAALYTLLAVLIVLQMADQHDLIEAQQMMMVVLILSILLIAVLLYIEPDRKSEQKRVQVALLSVLPLLVGTVADALNFCFGTYQTTVGLHISFLFFAVTQVGILMNTLQENARHSVQLEHDLLQSRVTLMLSQIKPHFLYNSLTAIKQLCATDPPAAEEAVGYFAKYLRSNLDALSSSTLIPLSREIAHTECYLQLEQMRFGDRVRVQYDLRYQAFSLPSLTMQPLVENAVRYGITKKRDGGTITIYTDETDTEYLVRVSDDGVGFDPAEQPKNDDRQHIGLENVRSRVAAMCEGTLEIESMPGKGTIATICIPKRNASGEE